jgi:hypothetical protein
MAVIHPPCEHQVKVFMMVVALTLLLNTGCGQARRWPGAPDGTRFNHA